ncbi:hypothetical protein B0T13DRAFT_508475 [Neurospora crassa]|nr:hypothetical protein B0T13DRAFT_508475 [Neurospora crassa]
MKVHIDQAPTQSNTAQIISTANTPPLAKSSTNPSSITTANHTAAKATPLSRPAIRSILMNGCSLAAAAMAAVVEVAVAEVTAEEVTLR